MTVTVFIPSEGKRDYILETLNSLYRQTRKPDRIIISFGKNLDKVNQILPTIDTDALLLIGDDDVLSHDYLEKTMAKLEEGYDIVHTGMQTFGQFSRYFPPKPFTLENVARDIKPPYTSLCLTKVFRELNGFDMEVGKCHDWDFWWRAAKKGYKAAAIDEPLFLYRMHPGQDSQSGGMEESRQKVRAKNV